MNDFRGLLRYQMDRRHDDNMRHAEEHMWRVVRPRRKFLALHGATLIFPEDDSGRKEAGIRWCSDRLGPEDIDWMSYDYWNKPKYAVCILDHYVAFEFKIAVG